MDDFFDQFAVRIAKADRERAESRDARSGWRFGEPATRRQVLGWLGGLTAAGTAALVGLRPTPAWAAFCQPPLSDCGSLATHPDCCTPSQACCDVVGRGGFCYDPTTNFCDPICGPLGLAMQCCGPGTAGPTGTRACQATETCCVDATGFATCCPPGQVCVDGGCASCVPCGAHCCPAGQQCCNGTCYDPATFCCSADAAGVAAALAVSTVGPRCGQHCCLSGEECCHDRCTTIGTNDNCFGCDDVCGPGEACCPLPGSDLFFCESLNDIDHCGACNNTCTGTDAACCHEVCINTAFNAANCGCCDCPCDLNKICCDSLCIDPLTDPNNCITCGNVCPPGEVCTRSGCCPPDRACARGCCLPGEECKKGKCKKSKPKKLVAAAASSR
ncbi:hypothetical protein Q5425_02885 [Amycolatopsis sp. A133]|uniref:hypothetical protein n=1 Tax=Amycolatopsis sp. A133 TaxID=3064472 RepID=UPI0027F3D5A9|nr:hypothetical protein [Amycolatopsis sp. A133]MDQ7802661.1 hypothetical protein [Amycolatopsis sp. A133]